jgi:hypothetical protein
MNKTIAVLLHEQDKYPATRIHFIWALCEQWKQLGIKISVLKGSDMRGDADLLIPHVDLTVLPEAYLNALDRYPRVINRKVRDISKRTISRNLLTGSDSYEGPVIVKTNLNFGGLPEAMIERTSTAVKRPGILSRIKRGWFGSERREWRNIKRMEIDGYTIFPSLKEVPEAIFANDALVVERFLPEIEHGRYHLRVYVFFGDRGYSMRVGSTEPVVKQKNIVSREEVPIPDELAALRREWGLDYGKMDYVIREGRVVVFDVNRTPGLTHPEERMKASAGRLAPGVDSFF